MAVTQKMNFDPGFLFTPSDTFSLGCTVSPQYKTLQTTDRQTTHRAKGTTDSTVGQKPHAQTLPDFIVHITCGRGLVLFRRHRRQCNTLGTSGSVNDVVFTYLGVLP